MRKFPGDFVNKIICGRCLGVLKEMPDECVDTIITSPPYWGLRDYGEETKTIWGGNENCKHKWEEMEEKRHGGSTKSPLHKEQKYKTEWIQGSNFCSKCGAWYGQLGLEPTLDLYLEHLLQIIAELKRVLKPTGVMFWNHGDSYGGFQGKFARWPDQKLKLGENIPEHRKPKQFAKCLLGQNYRLALRMVDEQNWTWRNTIIWWKPNCMPSSARDRFTIDYEPVFFFTKSKKYWFESQFENFESNKYDLKRMANARTEYGGKWAQESGGAIKTQRAFVAGGSSGRNKRCVWRINTQPFPFEWCPKCEKIIEREGRTKDFKCRKCGTKLISHFATFPEKLVEPMILSSCPKEICKKCGKARKKIIAQRELPPEEWDDKLKERLRKAGANREGRYYGKNQKDYPSYIGGASDRKRRILKAMRSVQELKGYTDCGCDTGWEPGIVLDPFVGAGTTCVVAKKLKRRWIGIDISKEYCRMARERIRKAIEPLF